MDEPARRRFGFEVELGQAALQKYPRALCGVGTPEVSLERDQPTVGVLADRIDFDAALERGERRLAATGLGLELGQSDVHVKGAPVQVLADRLDPESVARREIAAIGGAGRAQSSDNIAGLAGLGRVNKGALEAPQVDVEHRSVGPIVLSHFDQYLGAP